MITLHNLYIHSAGIHAVIDDEARLIHLYRLPGSKIAPGAIVAREMVERLLKPGFDGETLSLCAYGLLKVIEFVERTSRSDTSDRTKARRVARLVRSMGFRDDLVRILNRFVRGEIGECTGEQSVFEAKALEQLGRAHQLYGWAGHDNTNDACERIIAAMG
jgi:hypothetical protein